MRPGGAGADGCLTHHPKDNYVYLQLDCTVLDEGQFRKRKIFNRLTLDGPLPEHKDRAKTSRGLIRAMIESAHGIKPKDESDDAKKLRQIKGYQDLDGLRCMIRVGVLPPKDNWEARNVINEVITPDNPKYVKPEQVPVTARAAAATAAPAPAATPAAAIARPQWGN
jgi:hypothetical protein